MSTSFASIGLNSLIRTSRGSSNRARLGHSVRPIIERLEDRIVMSAFVVTLATDTGPINSTVTPLGGGTVGDLRNAIYLADQSPGTANTIDLTGLSGTINLSAMLPPIATSGSGSLTITGPGASTLTISGGGLFRDFFIVQGTVSISGLTIANGLAKGGNGGLGNAQGGGGGGAGMGGGLLIDGTTATTNVTLTNLIFSGNQAVGGAGGGNTAAGPGNSFAGGGGAGGNGGDGSGDTGGGGGFLGNGGNGSNSSGSGGGGGFTGRGGNANAPGSDIGGGGGAVSNVGGIGGGNGNLFDGGGGGSVGFAGSSAGANAASGGGGGFGGGSGGDDSGGNTGAPGDYGGAGGNPNTKGGFGGGGGARGPGGGFGGGAGGGTNIVMGGTHGGNSDAAGNAGGGAGLGGALFDRSGTVSLNNITFNSNVATGGASGGGTATAGKGKGGALYILGTVSGLATFGTGGNANTAGNALAVGSNPQDNGNIFGTLALPTSTTTVDSAPNPSTFGQSVTLTAAVTVASGTPTGSVTFKAGSTTIGVGTLSGGSATFTTSSAPVGSYSITAVYAGDSNFAGSTSSATTLTVNQASSTSSVTALPSPSVVGQTVTFTAGVTSTGGTPTGTVTFKDGSTTLGIQTLASGAATFSTSSRPTGSHSITVVYSGDANFAGGVSTASVLIVNLASSTSTVSVLPNPSTFGQTVTFTAAVTSTDGTPTGTVTFKDGSTTLGIQTLASGAATFSTSSLTTGSHSITVVYSGDVNFAGGVSTASVLIVNQAPSTSTVSELPSPSTFGQAVTFTANVTSTGGTPTGTVSFMDGSTTLGSGTLAAGTATFSTAVISPGAHVVTAVYAGDVDIAASTSVASTLTVAAASSITTLPIAPASSSFGDLVTFTADVTSTGGTPTGIVAFMDGLNTLGSGTLLAGVATFSTGGLLPGAHSITANYVGDGNFAVSSSEASALVVNQVATSMVFSQLPTVATPGQVILPIIVTVNDALGNPVTAYNSPITLAIDTGPAGGTLGGTVTVNAVNGVATFSDITLGAAGSYTLTAASTTLPDASSAAITAMSETTILAGAKIPAITATVAPTARKAKFTIALTGAPGIKLYGATSVRVKNGHISFKNLNIRVAGTYTLTISDAAQATVLQTTLEVSAGKVRKMAYTLEPANVDAGNTFAVAVKVMDRYGNTVKTAASDVTLTLRSNGRKRPFSGTATQLPVAGIATFADLSIADRRTYRLFARYGQTSIVTPSDQFNVV